MMLVIALHTRSCADARTNPCTRGSRYLDVVNAECPLPVRCAGCCRRVYPSGFAVTIRWSHEHLAGVAKCFGMKSLAEGCARPVLALPFICPRWSPGFAPDPPE